MKYNFKYYLKIIFSIQLILLCYYLYETLSGNFLNKNIKNTNSNSKIESTKKYNRSCEPINRSYVPYYVTIDGIKYPTHTLLHQNKSIDFKCLSSNSNVKKIFYMNKWFGHHFGIGYSDPFSRINCPITNCEILDDRDRLIEADYILIYGGDEHITRDLHKLKYKTSSSQKWIFVWYESYHFLNNNPYKNSKYFNTLNMVSNYKPNSDFSGIYETGSGITWSPNVNYAANYNHLKDKTHFAVALISNCNMITSKRLEYINELKNYIDVQVYGKCGEPCESSNNTNKCFLHTLAKKFKFYFAFENSICDDYVSEKFFKILSFPIIPVVLGGANYSYYVSYKLFVYNFNNY
jgi:alpha-1,3-fucosyltransferase